MTGIVWGELTPDYQSTKFCLGVYFLTVMLMRVQQVGRPVQIMEIGAGYGSYARLVGGARQRLLEMARPVEVQSYTMFDVPHVKKLQRWYLNQTLGRRVDIQDW